MRVVILKADLKRNRACKSAYTLPEWDEELQALVFEDWDAEVQKLLSSPEGTERLEWRVAHKLVPMTIDEFSAAKAAHKRLQ
jgi:hypothetical protein